MDTATAKRWIISMERQLDLRGHQRINRRLVDTRMPSSAKTPEERVEIVGMLMRDSLLWAFEELAAGRAIYAFRGYSQACGYAGFCGHDCVTSDAITWLRNAFEDFIGAGEVQLEARTA